ncbi:cell division protein FtsK [Rossellomorea arthrocnemi]|uniref:cell division protein FtsK n=1 Tax=Rossellomorea arthrocnemi TaxID=2769542 RepID=UPI00191942CA|nr:cell division protein FtsK [Rossellomorea arthrocnemi]
MKILKSTIKFFNDSKKHFYRYDDEGFSQYEKDYIENIKKANPYGLIVMIVGGISFAFGPKYVILPILTILFSSLTIWTFDKETEDNPWTFIVGLILAFTGLGMYLQGVVHHLVL